MVSASGSNRYGKMEGEEKIINNMKAEDFENSEHHLFNSRAEYLGFCSGYDVYESRIYKFEIQIKESTVKSLGNTVNEEGKLDRLLGDLDTEHEK